MGQVDAMVLRPKVSMSAWTQAALVFWYPSYLSCFGPTFLAGKECDLLHSCKARLLYVQTLLPRLHKSLAADAAGR